MRCPTCGHDPFGTATGVRGVKVTSKAMADQIAPRTGTLRRAVLDLLTTRLLTDFEITDLLDMAPSTERPRRGELVALGLVHDTGKTRTNEYNNLAIIWTATQTGHWAIENPGLPLSAEPEQETLF